MRINYNLLELKTFLEVARQKSFHRAAESLNLSASAVSRRVADLEQALETQLLERTTRSVELTEAGRTLLEEVAPLLRQLDLTVGNIVRNAKGEGGWLSIGCLTTVAFELLPKALRNFRQRFPLMDVQLLDDTGKRVTDYVLSGDATFAVTLLSAQMPELYVEPMVDDPYVLVLPQAHPFARNSILNWSDLQKLSGENLPLVALRPTSANRQQIDDVLEMNDISVPWNDAVEHLSSMLGLLRSGHYCAVMPRLALMACENWQLRAIPLQEPTIQRLIGLVRRKDTILSPPAQILWNLIRDELEDVKGKSA